MITTQTGRVNAIRFGSLLALDMQHRQHNDQNWPYFAPVIKDGDLSIGVICEAVVITENHGSYAWVLKKMSEMEPRFELKNIFHDFMISFFHVFMFS